MNQAMQMMPMMGMNPMMGGMNPMMAGMNPLMSMMSSMMPMMGMMPMMMQCQMTCSMTADGMVCEMKPMDASMTDAFTKCCDMMMGMMKMGMPMMMGCGGMSMMCMPSSKAA